VVSRRSRPLTGRGFDKAVISITDDPETSERWRAELAAGKLPQGQQARALAAPSLSRFHQTAPTNVCTREYRRTQPTVATISPGCWRYTRHAVRQGRALRLPRQPDTAKGCSPIQTIVWAIRSAASQRRTSARSSAAGPGVGGRLNSRYQLSSLCWPMRQRSRPNRSASRTALSSSGAPSRIRHQFDASHPSAPSSSRFRQNATSEAYAPRPG
jgi:hypothetical protein